MNCSRQSERVRAGKVRARFVFPILAVFVCAVSCAAVEGSPDPLLVSNQTDAVYGIKCRSENLSAISDLMQKERWREAAEACKRAVSNDMYEAYYDSWIRCLERLGQTQAVAEVTLRCIEQFPDRLSLWAATWTRSMQSLGRDEDVFKQLTNWWSSAKPWPWATVSAVADFVEARKQYEADAAWLTRHLPRKSPETHDGARFFREVGDVLLRNGRPKAAIAMYDEAIIELAEAGAGAHAMLEGMISSLIQALEKDVALEDYVVRLESRWRPEVRPQRVQSLLSRIAEYRKDQVRILSYCKREVERAPTQNAYYKLLNACECAGKTNQMIETIEQMIEKFPEVKGGFILRLARLYTADGLPAKAMVIARSVAATATESATYLECAKIAIRAGATDDCEQWLNKAWDLGPDPLSSGDFVDMYVDIGRLDRLVDSMMTTNADSTTILSWRGVIGKSIDRGQSRPILQRLEYLTGVCPANVLYWQSRAEAYERVMDLTNAVVCRRQVVSLTPEVDAYLAWLRGLNDLGDALGYASGAIEFLDRFPARTEAVVYGAVHFGTELARQGHTNTLFTLAERLSMSPPPNPSYYYNALSGAFDTAGLHDQAVRYAMLAVSNDQSAAHYRQSAEHLIIGGKSLESALPELAAALAKEGIPWRLFNRYSEQVKNLGDARMGAILSSADAAPDDAPLQLQAVSVLTIKRDYATAIRYARRAHEAAPTYGTFDTLLSLARYTKDWRYAVTLQRDQLAVMPQLRTNENFMVVVLFCSVYGNITQNVDLARQAVATFRYNDTIAKPAAELIQQAGCHDEAISVLTNSVAGFPGNESLDFALVLSCERAGYDAEGLAYLLSVMDRVSDRERRRACEIRDRLAGKPAVIGKLLSWVAEREAGQPGTCRFRAMVDWEEVTGFAYVRAGEHEKAVAFCRKNYRDRPTARRCRQLARALCSGGHADEAISMQMDATKSLEWYSKAVAEAELLSILLASGKHDEARSKIRELRSSPEVNSFMVTKDEIDRVSARLPKESAER